jgi:hypothetical protein
MENIINNKNLEKKNDFDNFNLIYNNYHGCDNWNLVFCNYDKQYLKDKVVDVENKFTKDMK